MYYSYSYNIKNILNIYVDITSLRKKILPFKFSIYNNLYHNYYIINKLIVIIKIQYLVHIC